MTTGLRFSAICALGVALAATLAFPPFCRGQGMDPNVASDQAQQQKTNQDLKERALSNQSEQSGQSGQPQQKGAPAPKVDAKENADYKAFFDTDPQNADKRIELGEAFVKQYPTGPYTEAVYAGLVQAYYMKQDWKNFYASADKALAINPNDVDVLITVGWVIPHVYDANAPGASKQLDKAEDYEKRALQDLATLPKPADMTDQQFAAAKAEKVAEAHSGLGLVYFRRQNFDQAAKELQQATQGASQPDPTDYYALGAALQNTQQYSQAADAFDHCAQIAGTLQAQCKQSADAAKKLAAQEK
jgi:tetratricopeptide (TPR) repeat protein